MTAWMTDRIEIQDTPLVVDLSPDLGPPVLLLHGIPGWRGTWRAAGQLLAKHHRVVIPDLAGFGDSDPPRQPMHATGHATMMFALLDRLGVEDVHLCGFDFGGPIAVSMCRLQPARIKTLTLLATNTFTDTPIPAPLQIARVPYLGEAAFRLMMGKLGLTMMWFAAVKKRRAFPLARYRQVLQFAHGLRSTRQVFVQSLRNLRTLYQPVQDALASVTAPTLVIWGDSDPFFPVDIGRRTAKAIPGARFLLVRECGHFVPEEHSDQVATAITTLIASATIAGLQAS